MKTASTTFEQISVAFIGGGNMAQALIAGLLAKGLPPKQIHVADPNAHKRDEFAKQGVHVYDATQVENTAKAIAQADVVILAVKPQVV